MALGLGNRIGGDACNHFEEGGGLFVEDGEFGEEFAVEAFDGVDGEVGVAAAEVGEDAVCVLGVDFGEEVFSSGDFGVGVYVGGMMIAPTRQNGWLVGEGGTAWVLFLLRLRTRRCGKLGGSPSR
jgi:hypothetical protein